MRHVNSQRQYDLIDDKAGNAKEIWAKWIEITHTCWAKEPSARPTFAELHKTFGAFLADLNKKLPPARDVGALTDDSDKKKK